MKSEKKETRGGKREGSGQPKKQDSEKAKALNVKIYPEHFEKLGKIHKNKSKAVRMAIDYYVSNNPHHGFLKQKIIVSIIINYLEYS